MLTGDGEFVRLTTKFRGPGMCLDIFNGGRNNNQPHLAKCDNFTGQLWKLTRTDKQVVEAAPRDNSTVQFPYTARAIKEIKLTEKQIQGVLSTEKELKELFGDQGRSAPIDNPERAEALTKAVMEKYGFHDPDEYFDVIMNIDLIRSEMDQQAKKFIEPPEQVEQEIAALKADKSVPEAESRERLAQLEAALSNAKPIQFKENIALVLNYFEMLPFNNSEKATWCAMQLRYLNCRCLLLQMNNPDLQCAASAP
jgi:hypothetical protein